MRIALCDTDCKVQNLLSSYIMEELSKIGEVAFMEKYNSVVTMLDDLSESRDYDVCFLSAEISGMNGVEVTREIKKYRPACMVVLYAATDAYAVAAWGVDAFFYLMMPTTRKCISTILTRLCERLCKEDNEFLRLKQKDGWYHVLYRNILYIESDAHKVNITFTNGQIMSAYGKLDNFESVLENSQRFIRIHKSVLIQGRYIKKFSTFEVECVNGKFFNVSRTALDKAREQYDRYIAGQSVTTVEF